MGNKKIILLVAGTLLVALAAVFYVNGWWVKLERLSLSATVLEEPAQSYS